VAQRAAQVHTDRSIAAVTCQSHLAGKKQIIKLLAAQVYTIENEVYRRWSSILADVLAMDNLHVGAAPQAFLRIFSEVTYIRTVGNSTLLKIYTCQTIPSP
jgi:hypothetical protein